MKKLVYGVGINDADYMVAPRVEGVQQQCGFYKTWKNMLKRCYSQKAQSKQPTYIGCAVCDEWLVFSNFKKWMEAQDWKGKHLDKDILIKGNKLYSPTTCVFVGQNINKFLEASDSTRGEYPIGVYFRKEINKFHAQCSNGNGNTHLGNFESQIDAHAAWREYKHKLACKLANDQTDPRVAKALRERFSVGDLCAELSD